jgi:hypothetical protein
LTQEKNVADIPIETLQRFSVLVNLCAAKALKVYPPLGLLNYADVRLPIVEDAQATNMVGVKNSKGCKPVP